MLASRISQLTLQYLHPLLSSFKVLFQNLKATFKQTKRFVVIIYVLHREHTHTGIYLRQVCLRIILINALSIVSNGVEGT